MDYLKNEGEAKWLDGAINLDVCHHSRLPEFHELANKIFDAISKDTVFNNKNRTKQTLKTILLNLWISYLSDNPIMYSRNVNKYSHAKRYGKIHFKYNRVIKIMDSLEEKGFMNQRLGYFIREDNIKRRTRIYADMPLIELFNDYLPLGFDVVEKDRPQEIIQLKDEGKVEIDYPETRETFEDRIMLYNYNEFISKNYVLVDIPCQIPIKTNFIKELKLNLAKGMVKLDCFVGYTSKNTLNNKDNKDLLIPLYSTIYNNNAIEYYNNNNIEIYPIPNMYINNNYIYNNNTYYQKYIYEYINTITNKLLIEKYSFIDGIDGKEKILLRDLGIARLVLEIKYSYLHRVFSKGSFELGGRFYGAFHLRLPKELRPSIMINSNKVTEVDYEALHPRMLYHMEGEDYRDDPYDVLCDNPDDRKLMKLVQLISLNAENEKKAVNALRYKIFKGDLDYGSKDEDLYPLIKRFKKGHKKIAKYYNSGVGLTLQRKDGKMTNEILYCLRKKGILALPVHDSYIVDEKYQDILTEIMVMAYEKEMGYPPVIGTVN